MINDCENIWKLFLDECNKDSFSKDEIIQGKKLKNFLGSIEKHKKLFDRAFKRFENGELINEILTEVIKKNGITITKFHLNKSIKL